MRSRRTTVAEVGPAARDEVWAPRRGPKRNRQWTRVSHGLHRPVAQIDRPYGDLPAWQLVLPPSGAFTHLTAAGVYGWWLPPLPPGLPVFACQSTQDPRPRRTGLHVTRHPRLPPPVVLDGLRLACPEEVLLACARDLGVLDLVVLVDGALRCGAVQRPRLLEVATGRPGARRLREAVALADHRSESPWESLLRVLHVVGEVGVEPQHEVHDVAGRFVARGDLWLRGTRTIHEYDGGVHLARAQQAKDLRRARELANAGWTRRGYTAQDVIRRSGAILRDADLTLGRAYRPERVRDWHLLLGESLFTATGTARQTRRWGTAAS